MPDKLKGADSQQDFDQAVNTVLEQIFKTGVPLAQIDLGKGHQRDRLVHAVKTRVNTLMGAQPDDERLPTSEIRGNTVEIIPRPGVDNTVFLGGDPIVLDKMFGPTIFAPLRITPFTSPTEDDVWVVERQSNGNWTKWAEIPAQLEEDFSQDED